MKKSGITISSLVATGLLFFACSKSNEVTESKINSDTNINACDTVDMKFSANVQSILQTNCTGCHKTGGASAGIILDTYDGVKNVASNGRLLGSITHSTGFSPMPKGGSKLSDCNINIIKSWINRGILNN